MKRRHCDVCDARLTEGRYRTEQQIPFDAGAGRNWSVTVTPLSSTGTPVDLCDDCFVTLIGKLPALLAKAGKE